MNVTVEHYSHAHALAHADGVRVRIRRYQHRVRWICDEHGRSDDHHLCQHTEALAVEPVPPNKEIQQ